MSRVRFERIYLNANFYIEKNAHVNGIAQNIYFVASQQDRLRTHGSTLLKFVLNIITTSKYEAYMRSFAYSFSCPTHFRYRLEVLQFSTFSAFHPIMPFILSEPYKAKPTKFKFYKIIFLECIKMYLSFIFIISII